MLLRQQQQQFGAPILNGATNIASVGGAGLTQQVPLHLPGFTTSQSALFMNELMNPQNLQTAEQQQQLNQLIMQLNNPLGIGNQFAQFNQNINTTHPILQTQQQNPNMPPKNPLGIDNQNQNQNQNNNNQNQSNNNNPLVETKSRIGSTVVTPINNKNTLFRGPSIGGTSMGDAFGYTAAELTSK
ncbi:MAG: hypothetical protein GY755_14895 [Chloroflexi bacterium]|nr:hypothetical protein [Chloroflexota bacterium]